MPESSTTYHVHPTTSKNMNLNDLPANIRDLIGLALDNITLGHARAGGFDTRVMPGSVRPADLNGTADGIPRALSIKSDEDRRASDFDASYVHEIDTMFMDFDAPIIPSRITKLKLETDVAAGVFVERFEAFMAPYTNLKELDITIKVRDERPRDNVVHRLAFVAPPGLQTLKIRSGGDLQLDIHGDDLKTLCFKGHSLIMNTGECANLEEIKTDLSGSILRFPASLPALRHLSIKVGGPVVLPPMLPELRFLSCLSEGLRLGYLPKLVEFHCLDCGRLDVADVVYGVKKLVISGIYLAFRKIREAFEDVKFLHVVNPTHLITGFPIIHTLVISGVSEYPDLGRDIPTDVLVIPIESDDIVYNEYDSFFLF